MSGSGLGSILMRFLPKLIKPAASLAKNVLAPLGLNAGMSAADAAIQKNPLFWFFNPFSNKETTDSSVK